MKKIFIFLSLFFFFTPIFSQSNYGDYTINDQQSIFYDDFFDNKNNWPYLSSTEKRLGRIENGYLLWQSKDDKTRPISISKYFDSSRNFQIEANLKIVSGNPKNHPIKIKWGAKGTEWLFYEFGITQKGKFVIWKYDNGWTYYRKYVVSKTVRPTSFNKLTIRKVNNDYYFFINETLVHSMPFEPFYGHNIGFAVPPNSTMKVDYLKIVYLEKKRYNAAPSIVITQPSNINRDFNIVPSKSTLVKGRAEDSDGIDQVTINGREASLQNNGYFSLRVPLSVGNNKITVVATDTKMKSSTKTFSINRKPDNNTDNFNTNEKRVALVFGNANYSGAAHLGSNPINDAQDITSTLKKIGFKVILQTNASLNSMNDAIRQFGRENKDADVALFYFAGHGMQVEKSNYLLPIGVDIRDKNDVNFECVKVSTVQKIMETSNSNRLNLIVLDACRNNPFRKWERGGETGLSNMTPPSGTLIAFSTSPGSTASNGNGRNGLYTGELIKQLKKPQRIEDVFINTRIEVENRSGGEQSPWELARLRGKFFLIKN